MAWILRKICNTISSLLSDKKPKRRVTFSESTLLRQFQQRTGSESSINSLLNFLTEVRCHASAPNHTAAVPNDSNNETKTKTIWILQLMLVKCVNRILFIKYLITPRYN
uniref:Uncharacterized protein n=1 Tax=Glossina austeni TaxID=7395 RepID=A0A1A9V084_GLOAU